MALQASAGRGFEKAVWYLTRLISKLKRKTMTPGYEYYDLGNAAIRDPNTYLNKSPLDMVRQFTASWDRTLMPHMLRMVT